MCHTFDQSLTCEPSNNAEASHNDKEDAFNEEFKVINPPGRLCHLYQGITSGKHALLFNSNFTKLYRHKKSLPLKGNQGGLTQSFDWYSFHVNLSCCDMNYEVFAQHDSKSRNINEKLYLPLEARAEFGSSSLCINFKRKREPEPFLRGCLRGTFPI